jgi:hypothetical protein
MRQERAESRSVLVNRVREAMAANDAYEIGNMRAETGTSMGVLSMAAPENIEGIELRELGLHATT